jgi:diguanylate cyclase (GGDEF)-like protein
MSGVCSFARGVNRGKAPYACQQPEVEGLEDRTAAATDTVDTHRGPFGDPLHHVRREKKRIRIGAYGAIAAFVIVNYFALHMNGLQTFVTLSCCSAVATAAIEYAFARFFRLRKQGVYPAMLAVELGTTHDFGRACEESVRLVAGLLGVEKVILALSARRDDQLTTMATHGISPEEVPLATPLPWCEQAVKQAMEGRKVVVTSASDGRAWLSGSDGHGRVVYVPLLSLDQFVGLLILVGGRKASDLGDRTLLTTIGLTIGLTLDNLRHSAELRQVATHDELTQLFNRRHFFQQLEKELKAARRSGRPLGLLILDVDNLKLINDTYGHNVGDAVLANFGKLLANRVRAEDIPARIGGDEFAVLMPDTDKRGAFATAARLEKALQARPIYKADGLELRLGVSCGVAGYPWSGENLAEIVQWADANMYGVKAVRKGRTQAAQLAPTKPQPKAWVKAPGKRRAQAATMTEEERHFRPAKVPALSPPEGKPA